MQAEEYNRRGKELVDYITKYLSSIRQRRVIPDVQPGYMRELLPDTAPTEPEDWQSIFDDVEKVIMPGVVHWQSPHMHAFFANVTSWPSMLADMLANAIGCVGFTWASSPACTELEMNVMDWLCKALGLPHFFLHYHSDSRGGGIIQERPNCDTAGPAGPRNGRLGPQFKISGLRFGSGALVGGKGGADRSGQGPIPRHRRASVAERRDVEAGHTRGQEQRAGPVSGIQLGRSGAERRGVAWRGAPLIVSFAQLCATLGTTATCAFDALSELGPVCTSSCRPSLPSSLPVSFAGVTLRAGWPHFAGAEEGLWLHVDAAYAGSAYLCPELRWSLQGVDFAHSFVFNPPKWMMVHIDCAALWVKDKVKLQQTFAVDPVYLRHENSQTVPDFMHWQIPLSRRFRSLKLWFVMRSFGLTNLQGHIRHTIEMAELLETLIKGEPNFEVPAKRHLGLVVFCLKEGNASTQELLRRLTRCGALYLIPAEIHGKRIIRFVVTSQHTTAEDIRRDWSIISKMACDLLADSRATQTP